MLKSHSVTLLSCFDREQSDFISRRETMLIHLQHFCHKYYFSMLLAWKQDKIVQHALQCPSITQWDRSTAAKSSCLPTCCELINIENVFYTWPRDAGDISAGAEVASALQAICKHGNTCYRCFTSSNVANHYKGCKKENVLPMGEV